MMKALSKMDEAVAESMSRTTGIIDFTEHATFFENNDITSKYQNENVEKKNS